MELPTIRPNLLAEILARGTVESSEGRPLPLHSHLPLLECHLLQRWLTEARPRSVLEIGMAYGIASLAICEVLRQDPNRPRFDIIDPFQQRDWQSIGLANMDRAGFGPLYNFHPLRSEFCLPRFLEQGKQVDFVFIDGWHGFDQVLTEFYYLNRMMGPGGILVFDDRQLPAIHRACAFVSTLPFYQSLAMPPSFAAQRTVRVRRLLGQEPHRLQAFKKTGLDQRSPDWFAEF